MVHQQFNRVFDLLNAYHSFQKEDLFNLKRNGEWKKYSAAVTLENIQTLALGLLELKVKPGDKIAIIALFLAFNLILPLQIIFHFVLQFLKLLRKYPMHKLLSLVNF